MHARAYRMYKAAICGLDQSYIKSAGLWGVEGLHSYLRVRLSVFLSDDLKLKFVNDYTYSQIPKQADPKHGILHSANAKLAGTLVAGMQYMRV